MSDPAIQVERLSKRYRIGQAEEVPDTLLQSGLAWLRSPLDNFRRLRNLSRFTDNGAEDVIWALRDVSFSVEEGEVVGIIGRNGAGKSTLLKILSRITPPTEGRVLLDGRVASLLEVGTGFHPELTGRENIYLNGTILGMRKSEIDQKFGEIVDFSGVEKFIDTPVKRYSSGMKVRLAFSVAAHLEPEILVIDEVLAVGDAAFQKKCLGKMSEIADRGRTVLFVSHNLNAVSGLTRRCFLLEDGYLRAEGNTSEVIATYLNGLLEDSERAGRVDLSARPRPPHLQDSNVQFQWVELMNRLGEQSTTFLEGEPITIRIGFRVHTACSDLQFGCTIGTYEGGFGLFTVPSHEFRRAFDPGDHVITLSLEPNRLRRGSYMIALKLFAAGMRQETLTEAAHFTIEPYLAPDDNLAYLHKWVDGLFRFDYEWALDLEGLEEHVID